MTDEEKHQALLKAGWRQKELKNLPRPPASQYPFYFEHDDYVWNSNNIVELYSDTVVNYDINDEPECILFELDQCWNLYLISLDNLAIDELYSIIEDDE